MRSRTPVAPTAPAETPADRLQQTVDELAQNVRVLTDVIDQLRADLSWLTRNGLPHQPIHVFVHRMPRATSGKKGNGALKLSLASWPVCDPTAETLSDDQLRSAVIDEVVQRLAEPLGQLAQEQLNELLSVMDHAHREVMLAIRTPKATTPADSGASPPRPLCDDVGGDPPRQLRLF